MAYDSSKGLISVATGYSGGTYTYTNIDKYIAHENLTITPEQRQDLDSYVNAKGYLKRSVLSHKRTKIDFNTPYLRAGLMHAFVGILNTGCGLNDGKCSEKQHKLRVRYFNSYDRDYHYAFCYFPDVDFKYGGVWDNKVHYMPTRVAFIEY